MSLVYLAGAWLLGVLAGAATGAVWWPGVAAIGVAGFIKPRMVKEGAIVIDVGMNRIPDKTRKSGSRLVGDVAFEGVRKKARAITPVPGGVGPMTIAMLLSNTVWLAEQTARR